MSFFRVGDVYEFKGENNCYGLLVTKKESGFCTFSIITEYDEGAEKNDFLTKSSINYHQGSQSLLVKILTLFLGGGSPEGYFGFMASEEIIKEISPNLRFRFSLNKLNSDNLFQIGGTSLARANELELIIKHCEHFKLSRNQKINLKDYA